MNGASVRLAVCDDARPCAGIVNDWIDQTDWMPRMHPHHDVDRYYWDVVWKDRSVWVSGDPVDGFLALDPKDRMVTALYVAQPGKGAEKRCWIM